MDMKSLLIINCFCLLILFVESFIEHDNYFGFCGNPECSVPVSKGIAILRYSSPDDIKISVEPNDEVDIYVKDYGPKRDLWGVVVNGNRGYISQKFIREKASLIKRLVPAVTEFKTSLLVTDSIAATQQGFVSSAPSQSFQQGQSSFSGENLHPSQFNPNLNPSSGYDNNLLSSQYNPNLNPSSGFDQNLHSSQFNPNLNPSSGFDQNLHSSHFNPNLNPSSGFDQNLHSSQINPNLNPNSVFGENYHSSQFNPNLNPSSGFGENHFASQFNPNLNPGVSENIHASQFDPSLNPSFSQNLHASQLNPSSGFSDNLHTSHYSPNVNPSNDIQFDSQLLQSSQVHDIHAQSSQFLQSSQPHNIPAQSSQFHPEHISSSSQFSGVQSNNILPSPTPVPDVNHQSKNEFLSDDEFLKLKFLEDSLSNVPNFGQGNALNFPQGGNYDPNSVLQSQSFQNIHQQQPGQPQQSFQDSNIPKMHSSFFSEDDMDEDMSKTFAILNGLGIKNTDMLGNEYTDHPAHQSSQNIQSDYVSSETELNVIPSQSQYSPTHGSDSSLHSTSTINQEIKEESNVVQHSNIVNDLPGNADRMLENIDDDENAEDEEALAEAEDNVGEEEEGDEGTEDDEATEDDADKAEEEILMKNAGYTETKPDVQSSMSFNQNQQKVSEVQKDSQSSSEDFQSSSETGVLDSSLTDSIANVKEKTDIVSDESSSSSASTIEPNISEGTLILQSTTVSYNIESTRSSGNLNFSESVYVETVDAISNIINPIINENLVNEKNDKIPAEDFHSKETLSDISEKSDALTSDNTNKEHVTSNINDFFTDSEVNSDMNNILNNVDIDGSRDDLTTYQVRNLKGEFGTTEESQADADGSNEENSTQSDSETYSTFENWLYAIKSIVDSLMSWLPEPLYSALMDLQHKGMSPRVPVFTVLCGFTCIFLIVPVLYIKEISKEGRLSAQLASVEKKAYTLAATNTVLEEKLESVQAEFATLQKSLAEKKCVSENLKMDYENQEEELENAKAEIESCLQVIDLLKEKENEYLTTIQEQEKQIERYAEHKEALDKIMKDQENAISDLSNQLQESDAKLKVMEEEKAQFIQMKEEYEEKLAQFEKNCNQLLQEAEVWNLRVQELSTNLEEERKEKQEFVETVKAKEEEIEELKELVDMFKVIEEIEDPEEQTKTKEEKLQFLMNSLAIVKQLKQEEEKTKLLDDQLEKEKNKILEMEVELLETKSEIDKLKLSYNQALQDKAEAQTKLDVLTNYFKDKEIQLQKQLGAQEAVRQKKEEDANSAERRIILIEQENASYKYQVASMKQEMEETERNLKSQIAAQEKKAHENWIAARAAERKLEDLKQEVTQLRQRLTLLEREQENWANAPRDEILRPVPKRMPGINDESGNKDLNTSERVMFPPLPHDRMGMPPPMMLPPDRPLPPLPPPPMFLPPMERHFRPQPWHIPPPDHSSDYRTTPPEFMAGREPTPPRGRPSAIVDGDVGPHTSSPLTTDTRDSRNSTPPHLLPDFHDVPPPPGRPFFPPPPLGHPRLPMHPPFRRDMGPGHKRLDHTSDSNSRGNQQPPPQEQWQHSRV